MFRSDPAHVVEGRQRVYRKLLLTGLALLVAVLYLFSRAGNLNRALVFEEPVFLLPGLSLFETGRYIRDSGVLNSDANAFHKPPLTSLLLGAGAACHDDPVVGARTVSLLIGLVVVLVPLMATGSAVPSLLILMSPFFYAAAGYLQTDPVVGLLGTSLLTWGMLRLWEQRHRAKLDVAAQCLVAVGLAILWLGKLETAMLASVGLGMLIVALPFPLRRTGIIRFLLVSLVCVLLLVGVSLLLGVTNDKSFGESVGCIWRTLSRQTGNINRTNNALGGVSAARHKVFRMLGLYRVPMLLVLSMIPAIISLPRHRERLHLAFLLGGAAAILGVPYMVIGVRGEGYPRHYLTAFVPLFILQGRSLGLMGRRTRWIISVLVLAVGLVGMWPYTHALMQSRGSPTAWYRNTGTREAVNRVQELTQEGDLVMGPGAALFYLHNRQKLTIESFVYSQKDEPEAIRLGDQLQAALVFRRMGISSSVTPVGRVLAPLMAREPIIEKVGHWLVIYRPRGTAESRTMLD